MQETVNTGHGDSDQDQPRYSCNNSDTTKLARMRQKENLETFLESLLLTEEHGYKTDGGSNTHTSLPPLSHVQRYPVSPLPAVDTPGLPSNLVTHDIIEIKTLLVKVKSLLEKESLEDLTKANADTTAERKYLEDQILEMKEELKLKNDKIEQLERILNTKKESVSTQTRKSQPAAMRLVGRRVSPAKSLHNISISHVAASTPDRQSPGPGAVTLKPCQHSWGPCANDHSYHHARAGPGTGGHQPRPVSPWSPASSSSGSGSFHDTVGGRYRRLETGGRYKKRALSADLLNNNTSRTSTKHDQDHKISIYVTHKPEKI